MRKGIWDRIVMGVVGLGLVGGFAGVAQGDTLIFSDTGSNSVTDRGPEFDPLASVTSSVGYTIVRFEITNQMKQAGNLKFVIFNENTSTLLYSSAAIAFGADTAETIKSSPVISFTMNAGTLYGFGAVSDVGLFQGYYAPPTGFSQNGITASSNGNVSGFASPTFAGIAGAEIPLNLYVEGGTAAAPLPSSAVGGLALLGVVGLVEVRRRRVGAGA